MSVQFHGVRKCRVCKHEFDWRIIWASSNPMDGRNYKRNTIDIKPCCIHKYVITVRCPYCGLETTEVADYSDDDELYRTYKRKRNSFYTFE